jgi:Na+/proline symporter
MGILDIALIIFIIVVVLSSAIGFYIHNKDDKQNDKFEEN